MSDQSKRISTWRKNAKGKLVDGMGGKCNKCGYSLCIKAMDFHHIDEKKKKFSLSSAFAKPRSWDDIVEEAKKCVLLCCRCHRELHAGVWKLSEIEVHGYKSKGILLGTCRAEDYHEVIQKYPPGTVPSTLRMFNELGEPVVMLCYNKPMPNGDCPVCGVPVHGTKTCGRSCSAKLQAKNGLGRKSKCSWPTKEEYLEMRKIKNRSQVAAMLGVSETAVRQREKTKYGL